MPIPALSQLQPYADRGLLRCDRLDGLIVWTYTQRCTHSRAWDEVTRQVRGLVYEEATGRLVALPWPKFFNLGEPNCPPVPEGPPDCVSVKEDGCLGIGFLYKGRVRWCTRGSLGSPQSKVAARIWREQYSHVDPSALEGITLLTEVVGPETRIILRYEQPSLILLGARRLSDGYDLSLAEVQALGQTLNMPVAVNVGGTVQQAVAEARSMGAEREGFVLRWGDLRIKVKSPAYLAVARQIQGLTERRVADHWISGVALSPLLPEESQMWAAEQRAELAAQVVEMTAQAKALAQRYDSPAALAREQVGHPLFPAAVRMIKGEQPDLRPMVYKARFGKHPRPVGEPDTE